LLVVVAVVALATAKLQVVVVPLLVYQEVVEDKVGVFLCAAFLVHR
jgi:hypothetical protein